jgi:glucan phosphoethanolaminetransferase (alkaline phosphatase superfamily)
MQLGDQRSYLSIGLGALTLWLFWRWREQEPSNWIFRSGLLWAISFSVLAIPMYAMLHAVLLGPMCALLLGIVADWKPAWFQRIWWITVAIFTVGLAVFITALIFTGTTGLHIAATSLVYRVIAPIVIGGIALASLFSTNQK